MKKLLLLLITSVFILEANDAIKAKNFCDELIITKDIQKISFTNTGNLIVSFASGATSSVSTLNLHKSGKENHNLSYIENYENINKVLVTACVESNKLITKTELDYFNLLQMMIVQEVTENSNSYQSWK